MGGLRSRRDNLRRVGAGTGRAIADRKDAVVQSGLQRGAHGKLVDAVCLEPGDIAQEVGRLHARGPDHEFGRNELAVGESYAVLEHLSHTRARSHFHAQLGQEVMGRFGDARRQSGQDPVPGLDQDDAKVALRVDPVEPVGDDGASGMVQFRRELGAGGACADDGDVQMPRTDGSVLVLRAQAGIDQTVVETAGCSVVSSGTAYSAAPGVPKSLVTLPTAITRVS